MELIQHERETSETMDLREPNGAALDSVALGLAMGITMATVVATISAAARLGWGDGWRVLLADVYPGYETDEGTVFGVIWGGVDGFLGGLVIGGLYNAFRRRTELR